MEKIYCKGKEYFVTDRVERMISKLDIMAYAEKILDSKNYQEGKIPEPILLAALLDYEYATNRRNWLSLLTSEVFGTGLVSYDVASKLISLDELLDWSLVDEKYQKGIITDEHLKSIFEIINQEEEEYCSQCEPVINSILIILISEAYENGQISDETIKLLLSSSEEESYEKYEIVSRLFNKEHIVGNSINDEMLKMILESKTPIITRIVYYIIISTKIKPEEKDSYILAMLSLENQESLSNIYNSYVEKKQVNSIDEFAKNFVLYTLPLFEFGLKVSHTRQRLKAE